MGILNDIHKKRKEKLNSVDAEKILSDELSKQVFDSINNNFLNLIKYGQSITSISNNEDKKKILKVFGFDDMVKFLESQNGISKRDIREEKEKT
jgi:hypothetical protein